MSPSRLRDIPLLPTLDKLGGCQGRPSARRGQQRLCRGRQWQSWANEVFRTPDANGRRGQVREGAASASQSRCLRHIQNCYRELGPPPLDADSDEAALQELLFVSVT